MIRGVNIGGYLVLERYITPYQFIVTDCHLRGEYCWYPHQSSAPPSSYQNYATCVLSSSTTTTLDTVNATTTTNTNNTNNTNNNNNDDVKYCTAVKVLNAFGKYDYPIDEKTLAMAFLQGQTQQQIDDEIMNDVLVVNDNTQSQTSSNEQQQQQMQQQEKYQIAEGWLNYHLEHFITKEDLIRIKAANITHLRVPIPHWILGYHPSSSKYSNSNDAIHREAPYNEVWIIGQRWEYFVRLCTWARELNLQVWPDIHTAPSSQNGFDNSGEALPYMTCQVWSNNPKNVNRSLNIIKSIAQAILDAGLNDVVTGFGLLNEPFADCIPSKYHKFIQDGITIVRRILGKHVAVYVSDMFQANIFNDGHWWINPNIYNNTYLDSHYYQVFDSTVRELSPRQHIAYTCTNIYRRMNSCCYRDGPYRNQYPSTGVAHMVGEWSASMDILPAARIDEVINGIVRTGTAPYIDRELTVERKEFLYNFIQAQIVTYEAASNPGISKAWFYWTIKMEGGAFMEWDMLRGIQDGWFPSIVNDPETSSESVYGSCYDIMWRTNDNSTNVLEIYPDPKLVPPETDPNKIIDDDVVLSHGDSLIHPNRYVHHDKSIPIPNNNNMNHYYLPVIHKIGRVIEHHPLLVLVIIGLKVILLLSICRKRCSRKYNKRSKYTRIMESEISMTV